MTVTARAGAEVIGLVLQAFVTIWVSRAVGPEGLGYVAVAQTVLRFGIAFMGAGFPTVGSQHLAHGIETPDAAWSTVIPVRLVLAFLLLVIAELVAALSPIGDSNLRLLLALSAPALLFAALSSDWLLIAVGHVKGVALARVAGAAAGVLTAIALVHGPDDLAALAVVLVAPIAIYAALTTTIAFAYALDWRRLRVPSWSQLRSYGPQAWHYLVADLSVLSNSSIDRIFLYVFATPAIVGLYEAAYRLIQPFHAIALVVNDSYFLRVANALGSTKREVRRLRPFADLMFSATAPVGFFLVLFSVPVVGTVYGPGFEESARFLGILGWSITIGYLASALSLPLMAWARGRDFARAQLGGTAGNLAANAVLVPVLSADGAALAVVISRLSTAVLAFGPFRRISRYPMLADFGFYAAISAGAAAVGLVGGLAVGAFSLFAATLMVLTYLVLAYVLRWRHSWAIGRTSPDE